jgi:hypothetical protein
LAEEEIGERGHAAEEEIGERGHAVAFALKRRGKQGVGSGAPRGEKDGGGGPVQAAPRGGRRRMGPGVPVAARERWRGALVGRCLAPYGSRGAGGARGLRVSAWAGRGRNELGWA